MNFIVLFFILILTKRKEAILITPVRSAETDFSTARSRASLKLALPI